MRMRAWAPGVNRKPRPAPRQGDREMLLLLLVCLLTLCPVQWSWGAIVELTNLHSSPVDYVDITFDRSSTTAAAGFSRQVRRNRLSFFTYLAIYACAPSALVAGVEAADERSPEHRRYVPLQRRPSVRQNLLRWRRKSG